MTAKFESRVGRATVGNTGRTPASAVSSKTSFTCSGWGAYRVYNSFSAQGKGKYKVSFQTFQCSGKGVYGVLQNFSCSGKGIYRVANDALSRGELYKGVDEAPDFTAAPWETISSLPHETAALDAGHTYHIVLRNRNEYNVLEQSLAEWIVEVDGDGNLVAPRPSAPEDVSIVPAADGDVRITASYNYLADGDDQATQWLLYVTSDGSDPDPAVDEPVVVEMKKNEALSFLDWTEGGYADGLTIKAIIRTRRVDAGPVNIDSTNTDIVSTVSDTDGPSAVTEFGIFFDDDYKQYPYDGGGGMG